MTDRKLKININGYVGVGKTIMAIKIKKFLESEGFTNIDFIDDEKLEDSEERFKQYGEEWWSGLKEDVKISIETYQCKRDSSSIKWPTSMLVAGTIF